MRLPAWRIHDVDGYIATVENKRRAHGLCAYIERDILEVKKVSRGNERTETWRRRRRRRIWSPMTRGSTRMLIGVVH